MAKHGKLNDGRPKMLKSLSIGEISSVTAPAQEGADALILKRRSEDEELEKSSLYVLTSAVEGHAHGIWLYDNGGTTSEQVMEGSEEEHSHAWMVKDGQVVIGEAAGHTHTVDSAMLMTALLSINKSKASDGALAFINLIKEVPTVADKDTNDIEKAHAAKVAELETKIEHLSKVASLDDAEKAHLDTLDEAGQVTFLGKSRDERKAELEAAEVAKAAGNEIVYTAVDGTVFRKSDDERLVKMAKELDETRKANIAAKAAAEAEEFAKQGETQFGHLPGERTVKGAIVRALNSISDEAVRKAAFEAVTAGNLALSKGFQSIGSGAATTPTSLTDKDSAADQLDKLAKTRMSEKGEDFYTAFEHVSKANPELAKKAVQG